MGALVQVRSLAADSTVTPGVLRLGERPIWYLDDGHEVISWVERLATTIRPLPREELPEAAGEPLEDCRGPG